MWRSRRTHNNQTSSSSIGINHCETASLLSVQQQDLTLDIGPTNKIDIERSQSLLKKDTNNKYFKRNSNNIYASIVKNVMMMRKKKKNCDSNNFNRLIIFMLSISIPLIPPIIMSVPGLYCRMLVRALDGKSYLKFLCMDIVPSVFENYVLLRLGRVIVTGIVLCFQKNKCLSSRSANGCFGFAMIYLVKMLVIALLIVVVYSFNLADYYYQLNIGVSPDLGVIRSSLTMGRSLLESEFMTHKSYLLQHLAWPITMYTCSIAIFFVAHTVSFQETPPTVSISMLRKKLFIVIIVLVFMYCAGGYTPILNITLCTVRAIAVDPLENGLISNKIDHTIVNRGEALKQKILPNIIFIIHESLSAQYIKSERGRENMKFFSDGMTSELWFNFRNTRTVSGSTAVAVPAIATGLNPINKKCMELMTRVNLAAEFRELGYQTLLFSSWQTKKSIWAKSKWSHILDTLLNNDNYDGVFDPDTTGESLKNDFGMDDRNLVEKFVQEINVREQSSRPFFAVHVWNNAHYPHLVDERTFQGSSDVDRYIESLRITDQNIEKVYEAVLNSGQESNTIIIGVGDHGEVPIGTLSQDSRSSLRINQRRHWRLRRLDDIDVVDVPFYMHIPKSVINDTKRMHLQDLSRNYLVSTLDIVPTLRSLLGLEIYSNAERANCNTGLDLLSVGNTNDDRTQFGYQSTLLDTSAEILTFSQRDRIGVFYPKIKKFNVLDFPRPHPNKVKKLKSEVIRDMVKYVPDELLNTIPKKFLQRN